MNLLEMLGKLIENDKRKARCIKDHGGNKGSTHNVCVILGKIVWEDNIAFHVLCDSKSEWEIIEPPRKLKEMCFGEAYYEWAIDENMCSNHVRSVLSGLRFGDRYLYEITKEEYTGKWTIEGIYEDESEDK